MTTFKSDFPIFSAHPDLVYLDSAATAQKPAAVIDAIQKMLSENYANIHRGLYPLSEESTAAYEGARSTVKKFIGQEKGEVIFTKSATEASNLLAYTLPQTWNNPAEMEVVLSARDHHAVLVPWQESSKRYGFKLSVIPATETITPELIASKTTGITGAIILTYCSNVTGEFVDVSRIAEAVRPINPDTHVIVDASQAAAHVPLAVKHLEASAVFFSGHKMYGPSGIGVLSLNEKLTETLPPFLTGGDMVLEVSETSASWQEAPAKFEAGTPNIEGAIGLAAAADYLAGIGWLEIAKHTSKLHSYATEQLLAKTDARIIGEPVPESGIISFTIPGIHPHDLASLLGERTICIRAGHHCAMPLHKALGIAASNRISIGLYTTKEDIDTAIQAISEICAEVRNA